MSLKIILLPFSIILTLILGIGYIKPDIGTYQEKQAILQTKKAQVASLDTLVAHVESLETTLAASGESEKLVDTFVPKTMDQERVIDTFNYLASQSGVFVNIMAMSEGKRRSVSTEITVADPAAAALSAKPQVETFAASVEVRGSYEGIKDFFNRLAHTNRFHVIKNFSLAVAKEGEGAAEEGDGILTGVFESEFDYFPALTIESALHASVFGRGSFDDAALSEIVAWTQYSVSPLQEPVSGRPNPFR